MTAGLYNFECTKGSALAVTISVKNPDSEKAQLTSWASRMQIRKTMNAASPMLELTNANGRLVHNVSNGTITVTLTSAETNALTSGGIYDLEIYESNSGTVIRLLQGNFNLVTS